jgi:predicted nucleic acid-binding protein
MIVLDTNVISALIVATPEPLVVAWLNAQQSDSVWTTAISVFEAQLGLAIMPSGRRRETLQESFDRALHQMGNQVIDFDAAAAREAAAIAAKLRSVGRPIEMRDVMIAGTVAANHGTLATRNTKHFTDTGIALVNPWQSGQP